MKKQDETAYPVPAENGSFPNGWNIKPKNN